MTFTESNLAFDFDNTWTDLTQYDQHPDVLKVSGQQLTCIDFLGILDNEPV